MDLTHIVEELQSLVTSGSKVPGFGKKVMVDIKRLEAWLVTNDVSVSRICQICKTRERQTAELL